MFALIFQWLGSLTKPWRWINAEEEAFGEWLLEVRRELIAGRAIDLGTAPGNVNWVRLNGSDDHRLRLQAGLTRTATPDGNVLIIADSTNPEGQRQFASQIPGAVTVESVDLKDLITFAKRLDLSAGNLVELVVRFASTVMTNVGATHLLERIAVLQTGRARREASEVEKRLWQ